VYVLCVGIEEHKYSGTGSNLKNGYYFQANRLLGSLDSNGTQFYLTDALGSLVSDFTNAAGEASLNSNELYETYSRSVLWRHHQHRQGLHRAV
jgi:hypothetical protein